MESIHISMGIKDGSKLHGTKDTLEINKSYKFLDLSNLKCKKLVYCNQKYCDIENHILPSNLEILDVSFNKITILPKVLPDTLKELYCDYNFISELPKLPPNLRILNCGSNNLTSLPELPKNLFSLVFNNNRISTLENLPDSLEILKFPYNRILHIDNLPSKLLILECSYNNLEYLGDLPDSLSSLISIDNKLNFIPKTVKYMEISFYQDKPIKYIEFNDHLFLEFNWKHKIVIENYGVITNQKELNEYMESIRN